MSQPKSRYQNRPGVMGTSGRLEPIEGPTGLRNKQERRIRQSCTISDKHDHGIWFRESHRDLTRCDGVPWPTAASRRAEIGVHYLTNKNGVNKNG
jgi:hypothetical protein